LGWIGAFALVGWAIAARRRWQSLQKQDGSEPGAPERIVWQRLASYSVIAGHMTFALANPQYDLHVGSGNYLAVDNWTLILGMMVSAVLFRADRHDRDERDDRIDAVATRWRYRSLVGMLIPILLVVGFWAPEAEPVFANFFAAHIIIAAILASLLIGQVMQLLHYARDGMDRS
jgi:hypothetical protein